MQGGPRPAGSGPYHNQAEAARGTYSTGANDNPRTVAITDEYGNQCDSRGERIGQGRAPR